MRFFGHFGFSPVGSLFLLMLFIPNLLWSRAKPRGYTAEGENPFLLLMERTGEVLTCCCSLVFSDFDPRPWTPWSMWFIGACLSMLLYEGWWARYFRSERRLADFYSGFLGIPLAGAVLPVTAFLLLGIYGRVGCLILSALILGIGHIGIHMQHKQGIIHGKGESI